MNNHSRKHMGDYEELLATQVEGRIMVTKLRSLTTGLTVVVAEVESPVVYGYFTLATEAHDNDGLPHTLEHLVFMGSKDYPYKGVLDKLANRCFARGTNAWTDTDHTAYTIDTAGKEGFLNILPVFLDHILRPQLTRSSFITEVHHINGSGDDAGVVYAEMQARENSGQSRASRMMSRMLYGDPAECGYAAETGGLLANIRQLSHEKVKNYHTTHYRPNNLCAIVIGKITPREVVQALDPVERIHAAESTHKSDHPRPWFTTSAPPLAPGAGKSVTSIFPSDDNDIGAGFLGWRGPIWSGSDPALVLAVAVMQGYLTDGATSPLRAAMVDCMDPICSDVVCYFLPLKATAHIIYVSDVPVSRLQTLQDRIAATLAKIVADGVDMQRMQAVIASMKRRRLASLESSPAQVLAAPIIYEFIYSEHGQDLGCQLNHSGVYDQLSTKPASFWVSDVLNAYFNMKNVCYVRSVPSTQEGRAVKEAEMDRVRKQKDGFNGADLTCYKDILEYATSDTQAVPESVITSLPFPDSSKIPLIEVGTLAVTPGQPQETSNPKAFAEKWSDQPALPLFVHVSSVATSVITVSAVLDTHMLTLEERRYLNLYLDLILESPIKRGNAVVPYEQVVMELLQSTVSSQASIGFGGDPSTMSCGFFSQCIQVSLTFEQGMYAEAVQWMKEILMDTIFTADRIKVSVARLSSAVPSAKRSGQLVASALSTAVNFSVQMGSNKAISIPMRQGKFLHEVQGLLEATPEVVVEKITNLRRALTVKSNIRLSITLDASKVEDLSGPIVDAFGVGSEAGSLAVQERPYIASSSEFASPRVPQSLVCGMDAIESSYLLLTCDGVTSYTDPDYPIIRVLFEMLTALEGPLWNDIRGLGLAYSFDLQCAPEDGLLVFGLLRCSNLIGAYEAGINLLRSYVSDPVAMLDEKAIEAAKAGCVYGTISKEQTVSSAAFQRFLNSEVRRVDRSYTEWFLDGIARVSVGDLSRILQKYVGRLVESSMTSVMIATTQATRDSVIQYFEEEGRSVGSVEDLDVYMNSKGSQG